MKTKILIPGLLALSLLSACAAGGDSDPGPAVQEHWDAVTQAGQGQDILPAIGSRWYDQYMRVLLPRDDYGELAPFEGAKVRTFFRYTDENGREQTEYVGYIDPLYGLITLDGRVVLEPVCGEVNQLTYYTRGREAVTLPVWLLTQASREREGVEKLIALCALDGSWATDFVYWGAAPCPQGIVAADETGVHLLEEETGTERKAWSWEQLGIDRPEQFPWFTGDAFTTAQWVDGRFFLGEWGSGDAVSCYLDLDTDAVTRMPYQESDQFIHDWYDGDHGRTEIGVDDETGTITVTAGGQSHSFPDPLEGGNGPWRLGEDRLVFSRNADHRIVMTDLRGNFILDLRESPWDCISISASRPRMLVGDADIWTAYDRDGNRLGTFPREGDTGAVSTGSLIEISDFSHASYYNTQTWECVFRVYFGLGDLTRP